ncbi:MAG: hypothetical protein KGJ30_09290 [Burkholderiales bacterium]|nr:hypothetical protein [Burkholderiales bacterium]
MNHLFARPGLSIAIACAAVAWLPMAIQVQAAESNEGGDAAAASRIKRGFEIVPGGVALNLAGRNRALVGLGSYLVNSAGCSDCHTHPGFAPGGNPYLGQPEMINAGQYLAGGRTFPPSPFVSANITPDYAGHPAGLTLTQFLQTLRTGHNPNDAQGALLQVMPWPFYGKMTDRDLQAMYEYLRAVPSLPDNPDPGPLP